MKLDAPTLLFSLILINGLMVLSLFVAAANGKRCKRQDGIRKWAFGLLLETIAWTLAAARGAIPDSFSIIAANGFLSATYALMLAAIAEFQQRSLPRWQYFLPVLLTVLVTAAMIDDVRGRFVWGGLVYGLQMGLMGRTLLTHAATRSGKAWRLQLGGIVVILLVLAMRAIVALSGEDILSQPQLGGAPHWVQIVSFVAVMATSLLGSVGFVLMVKERADHEIMQLAMTDSLTGVPNRRALMDYAERTLATRGGRHVALMMIDVDHFKRINDTCGHPAGDEVLRRVAGLLSGRLRGSDLVGRYGGEEFCVVAVDTDAGGAMKLANSLREIVASHALATESGNLSVTVSIGVSFCPAGAARELKDVLAEADAALYNAKSGGRNQVFCFGRAG